MKKKNQNDNSVLGKFSQNSLTKREMKQVSGGSALVEYILLIGVVA
jgi:hypothetical protein